MPSMPQHFNDPVIAGLDIVSGAAIMSYWFDLLAHPIGVFSTLMAGLWYALCIYDAIERRWKSKNKDE